MSLFNQGTKYENTRYVKAKDNKRNNRVELKFKDRPNNIVRNHLKQTGYKYDSNSKVWYAPLSKNNIDTTRKLLDDLK